MIDYVLAAAFALGATQWTADLIRTLRKRRIVTSRLFSLTRETVERAEQPRRFRRLMWCHGFLIFVFLGGAASTLLLANA